VACTHSNRFNAVAFRPTAVFVLGLFVPIVIAHVRCVCVVDSIGVSRQCRLLLNARMHAKNYFGPSLRGRALRAKMHIAGILHTFGQERHGALPQRAVLQIDRGQHCSASWPGKLVLVNCL
jgi:hypothetical protein